MTAPTMLRIVPKNQHDLATLTTSVEPVGDFPVANTQHHLRDRAWRTADLSTITVFGVLPRSMTATFFGMFRHRNHGGKIEVKLYSGSAWMGVVYDSSGASSPSVPLDIMHVDNAGFAWGDNEFGVGDQDPFVQESPFWLWFPPVTYRSYTITLSHMVGSPPLSPFGYTYWQVSRFWLGKHKEFNRSVAMGITLGWADNTDRARTRGGSLRTNLGERWRVMKFSLPGIDDTERSTMLDILAYAQLGRDMVVSVYPEDTNHRLERDYMINGKLAALDVLNREVPVLTTNFQVEEL